MNRVNRWLRTLLQTGGGFRPCDPLKTKTKTLLRRKNKKRSPPSRWSEIEHDTSLAGSRWLPDGHRSAAKRHRKMAFGTRSGADLGIPGRFRRIQNVAFNMLRVTWNPLKQGGLPTFSMRSPMRPEDRRHPQIFQTRLIEKRYISDGNHLGWRQTT